MDMFIGHPWAAWVCIAIVCAILEMTVPSFTCLFGFFSAVIAALVALRFDWPVQLCVFALALVSSVVFLRPFLLSRFPTKTNMPSRSDVLVGLKGTVTAPINPASGEGRVLVEGNDWAASCDHPISVDTKIVVVGHDGITLKVKES